MKTKCICKFRFEPEIKRKTINEDIQDIYFECPRCKEQYHVAYTNAEIRKLNAEMQQARAELMKDKNNDQLFAKVRNMMIKHKEMTDKLNKKGAENNG